MSIDFHSGNPANASVTGPEKMYSSIIEMGIVPFFAGEIPGFSIEEMTPPSCWFTSDNLGPWDWKIDCIQSGDIAYGKYLKGGKAAFSTIEWYRHIMNYRRSLGKYAPDSFHSKILELVTAKGSMTSRELRKEFALPKGKMDAAMTKLQMSTRIIIGDIQRVYKGEDLHYSGWQLSSFCTPEDLFSDEGMPFPGMKKRNSLDPGCSPSKSYEALRSRILELFPGTPDKAIAKILG